jgi:hypothetical protein
MRTALLAVVAVVAAAAAEGCQLRLEGELDRLLYLPQKYGSS